MKIVDKKFKITVSVLVLLTLFVIVLVFLMFGGTRPLAVDKGTSYVSISIPVGAYSEKAVQAPCGFVTQDERMPFDDPTIFDNPKHYLARLIWFGKNGFLEYKLRNPLPPGSGITSARLFLEACSEAPHYDLKYETDLSLYINGIKICTCNIKGDFGGKKGTYPLPAWWPISNTQYGVPLSIEIRDHGTYIGKFYSAEWLMDKARAQGLKKVSNIGIRNLDLEQEAIVLRIGVDKDAKHMGGMNLFGEKSGNYPDTLTLGLEYKGEKILEPTISEIIAEPWRFANRRVILEVHPGGWSCPPGKSTPIPLGLSRSATMVYDSTGCLYGSGDILIGKILSPELHTANIPGKETIVMDGKIRLDNRGIPFISPSGRR